MKRKSISIIIVFFVSFIGVSAETYQFQAVNEYSYYKYTEVKDGRIISSTKKTIEKGSILSFSKMGYFFCPGFSDDEFACCINAVDGLYPMSGLAPVDTENTLPFRIITHGRNKILRKAIPLYLLNVLYSGNAKNIDYYEEDISLDYSYIDKNNPSKNGNPYYLLPSYQQTILEYGTDEKCKFSELFKDNYYYPIVSNVGIRLPSEDYIIFKNIRKISDDIYQCTGIGQKQCQSAVNSLSIWSSHIDDTPEGKSEKFKLTIDGDYLSIDNETTNTHIMTLVYVDKSVIDQVCSLLDSNNCNLKNVNWPRHKDGSCDYIGNKKLAVPVFTVLRTVTNLRLRVAEQTSSAVITTMNQGTDVIILKKGNSDIIDGITGTWVKIKVLSGGKDKDGYVLPEGTVGWCFGGYLNPKQ